MSDQDGDLPEMNDGSHDTGPPGDGEPLAACPIDPEERLDTERVLGLFAPRTPRLKRERLLALVASVRREVAPRSQRQVAYRTPWYWPAATAAMTVTSLSLAVVLAARLRSEPPLRVEYQERIVYQPVYLPSKPSLEIPQEEAVVTVPQATSPVSSLPAPPDDYLRSRSLALEQGVDSIEFRRPLAQGNTPSSPATRDELLRQLGPTKVQQGMSKTMRTGVTNRGWIWPSW